MPQCTPPRVPATNARDHFFCPFHFAISFSMEAAPGRLPRSDIKYSRGSLIRAIFPHAAGPAVPAFLLLSRSPFGSCACPLSATCGCSASEPPTPLFHHAPHCVPLCRFVPPIPSAQPLPIAFTPCINLGACLAPLDEPCLWLTYVLTGLSCLSPRAPPPHMPVIFHTQCWVTMGGWRHPPR